MRPLSKKLQICKSFRQISEAEGRHETARDATFSTFLIVFWQFLVEVQAARHRNHCDLFFDSLPQELR
jgi:hypothetical protein